MVSDEDIQKQWQKIRNLDLAQMTDGTYQLAKTTPSQKNAGPPNVDLFVTRRMSKEDTYFHLQKIYEKMQTCPKTGNQTIQKPYLDTLFQIKRLI